MKRNRFDRPGCGLPGFQTLMIIFSGLILSMTLAACSGVKETPQTQNEYRPMSLPGQVSHERLQALKNEYPKGYYREPRQPIAEEDKIRIGIISFEGSGSVASLADQITDYFTTDLVQSGSFKIYERNQMDKLVAEIELGQTGILNDDTVQQVGQMAGIELMVTGKLSEIQGRQRIDVKVINVRSGRLVLAEKMDGTVDPESISFFANRIIDKLRTKYYKR